MSTQPIPHIIVIGGGFGGLAFCRAFPRGIARITLLDRTNHHLFQPLLYQVATAGLSVPDIAQPIRSIVADRSDITVLMDEVVRIDAAGKKVVGKSLELSFDYLVIAAGARTTYFGHPEWAEHAFGLKTVDDAVHIRRCILSAIERAEMTEDAAERARLMTVVVVGGGPTGVELAGAFAELFRHTLKDDFRNVDPTKGRIVLIESGPRLLNMFTPELADEAARQLQELGVEVKFNSTVKDIRHGTVVLPTETLLAETVVWGAGVEGSPVSATLGVPLARGGRIKVEPDLSLPGHPEIFAIGDIVSMVDVEGNPVPGVAPAAMQMGSHVAALVQRNINQGGRAGGVRDPFVYWDKGTMATIGRSRAVAMAMGLQLSGWPAWMAWLVIHLMFLSGLRNKVSVVLSWMYSWFTYNRSSRVIYGVETPLPPAAK